MQDRTEPGLIFRWCTAQGRADAVRGERSPPFRSFELTHNFPTRKKSAPKGCSHDNFSLDFQIKARPGRWHNRCTKGELPAGSSLTPSWLTLSCSHRICAARHEPGSHTGCAAPHRHAPAQVKLSCGSPTPRRATFSVRINVPPLDRHTAYLSQRYYKLQMTLITYGLLKPGLRGPTEQTWPAQDSGLLEYHVLHKAPNTVTVLHLKLRIHLTTFCLTSAAQSFIAYPPYPSFQTEQVWRKPEIGLLSPQKHQQKM